MIFDFVKYMLQARSSGAVGGGEGRKAVQHTKIDDPMPALHLSLKCTSAFRV